MWVLKGQAKFYYSETLKRNSTDATHQGLFPGVGEYYCTCEQSYIKPLQSLSAGSEESMFENGKNLEV